MTRILVVDDHPALRAGVESVLRAEPGLTPVGVVAHPEEALPGIDRSKPDVVLLDQRLPGEDGLSLCTRIKARPDPPKVLIYSALARRSLAEAAANAGADGVLNKGASTDELLDAIRLVARGATVFPPPRWKDAELASQLEIVRSPRSGGASWLVEG